MDQELLTLSELLSSLSVYTFLCSLLWIIVCLFVHIGIQKVNPGAQERQAVPVSYKTPAVLVIVKFSQNLVSHRGKKQIYVKSDFE
jgi:uncharacterized membrane protein